MQKILILLFCILASTSKAQNMDSILQAANAMPTGDTNRLLLLAMHAWNYQYVDAKKAIVFAENGLAEAKKTKFDKAIYKFLATAGTIEQGNANYAKSIAYFNEGIVLGKKVNNAKWLSTCYNNLANTYNVKGDVQPALLNYENALALKEKNPNAIWGDIYINIGALYYRLQDSATALKKFKIGLQDTLLDGFSAIVLLGNITNLYCGANQLDSSKKYLALQKKIIDKHADVPPEQLMIYYISVLEYQIKFEKNNTDISLFNKAIALSEATKIDGKTEDFYRLKMKFYENQSQIDSAIVYAEKCIVLEKKASDYFNLKNDGTKLASFYSAKGETKKALDNMLMVAMASDSLYNLQTATASRNAEVKYDTKQKEEKNILLEKQKNTQLRLKNLYLLLGILVSLFIAVIAYSFFRSKIKTEKLNTQIEQKSIALEKSNAFKTKILSIISHDVRAPITGLQNLISLQNSGVLSAEKSKELDVKIENALKNTSFSLDNLLQWSIGQMQENIKIDKEQLHLRTIIADQVNLLATLADAKQITIQWQGDDTIHIHTDKNALALIVRNIISNAIKFSHIGGTIIINQCVNTTGTSIVIQDFGDGISKENLAILGNQFSDSKLGTANEKGVGLGHILIAEYCSLIGAKINIDSELGSGTSVSILL
jgi:signal transduction histidine kinase